MAENEVDSKHSSASFLSIVVAALLLMGIALFALTSREPEITATFAFVDSTSTTDEPRVADLMPYADPLNWIYESSWVFPEGFVGECGFSTVQPPAANPGYMGRITCDLLVDGFDTTVLVDAVYSLTNLDTVDALIQTEVDYQVTAFLEDALREGFVGVSDPNQAWLQFISVTEPTVPGVFSFTFPIATYFPWLAHPIHDVATLNIEVYSDGTLIPPEIITLNDIFGAETDWFDGLAEAVNKTKPSECASGFPAEFDHLDDLLGYNISEEQLIVHWWRGPQACGPERTVVPVSYLLNNLYMHSAKDWLFDMSVPPNDPTGLVAFQTKWNWGWRSSFTTELWTLDPATEEVAYLEWFDIADEFRWSPDHQRIAYEIGDSIHIRDTAGIEFISNRIDVSDARDQTGDSSLEWSPDGTKIVFYAAGSDGHITAEGYEKDGGLFVVNADGSNLVELVDGGGGKHSGMSPSWSPDSGRVAFVDEFNISVINADGTGKEMLATFEGEGVEGLAWSPDGSLIAFTKGPLQSYEDSGYTFTEELNLFVMSPDGSNVTLLVGDLDLEWNAMEWSPDSSQIAFVAQWPARGALNTDGDIYVVNADGTDLHHLAYGNGERASWSPDGSQLVFIDGDNWTVTTINPDGTNRHSTGIKASAVHWSD